LKPLLGAIVLSLCVIGACRCETLAAQTLAKESGFPSQQQTATIIHQAALVLDAHADIIPPGTTSPYAGADGRSQVEPSKMRTGGVDAVVMSVAVGPGPRDAEGYRAAQKIANEKLAGIQAIVADASNNAVIVRTADDLVSAHKAGKLAMILGFQNARILGTDVAALDTFYEAGVRVFALTHMGHNDFADSSRPLFIAETNAHEPEAEHGGLSKLGVSAIERINALGGVVDVSQLSKQATLQAIALSKAPVIASHSNVRALSDVSRNLSDEEIDRIGASDGVIHVAPFRGYLFDSSDKELDAHIRAARRAAGVTEDYLYPFELYWEIEDPEARAAFTGAISDLLGPGSLDVMLDHIDYIAKRIGVDHVGVGTDFNHGSKIKGFADASEALNVTVGLVERGYSASDIKKIWGENFLRVFRAAESLQSR
jgi:membrane dipeptidase